MEKAEQQRADVGILACLQPEAGGSVRDLRGFPWVQVHVEADTDDGMAHFSALERILYEQAAQLTTTDENVVGPLDNRVEVRLFLDGPRYRQGSKDAYVGQRLQGGTQHDGEDEVP